MSLSFARGGGAWKNDPEFSEFAELSVNLNQSGVLLDNDVEAQRKPETGTFAWRFGSEEWVEHLLPHLGRNARAVIANSDFDAVTEVSGCGGKRRLIIIEAIFGLAFYCRIETVRDQVEQHARDLLRQQFGFAGGGIEILLQPDLKTLLLDAGAVVGELEALANQRIDVDSAPLTRAIARVHEHIPDDRVGAPAVLHYFFKIALQQRCDFVSFAAHQVVEGRVLEELA